MVVSSQTLPTAATHLPVVSHYASAFLLAPVSTQALPDDDPVEEFFQHSVMNFLCLMLYYLDTIKNTGGPKRAISFWAHLTTVDEQVQALYTL